MTNQRRLSNLSFVLLALVILLCVNWLWQNDNHVDQLEYSQVRQLFLQEKVTGLTIDSGGTLTLELREPVNGSETVRYELYSFQLFYDDFNDLVQQQYAEGIIQHYDLSLIHIWSGERWTSSSTAAAASPRKSAPR